MYCVVYLCFLSLSFSLFIYIYISYIYLSFCVLLAFCKVPDTTYALCASTTLWYQFHYCSEIEFDTVMQTFRIEKRIYRVVWTLTIACVVYVCVVHFWCVRKQMELQVFEIISGFSDYLLWFRFYSTNINIFIPCFFCFSDFVSHLPANRVNINAHCRKHSKQFIHIGTLRKTLQILILSYT